MIATYYKRNLREFERNLKIENTTDVMENTSDVMENIIELMENKIDVKHQILSKFVPQFLKYEMSDYTQLLYV